MIDFHILIKACKHNDPKAKLTVPIVENARFKYAERKRTSRLEIEKPTGE